MTDISLMAAPPADLHALAAHIVTSYVGHHATETEALPGLIKAVYDALAEADSPRVPASERPMPAVPVKRSVFPDYIVCLEDGKKLKMLKRHLASVYGLIPDAYRDRWGLPKDYPMVAPSYATRRSALAREIGLGRRITAASAPAQPAPTIVDGVVVTQVAARRRGRKPKAA